MTNPAPQQSHDRPPAWTLGFATLGAPAAWAAHLGLSYLIVPESCRWGTTVGLHLVTLTMAVTGVVATLLAGRVLRHAGDDAVERFVGSTGLVVGVLFTVAILVGGLPVWLVDPCR